MAFRVLMASRGFVWQWVRLNFLAGHSEPCEESTWSREAFHRCESPDGFFARLRMTDLVTGSSKRTHYPNLLSACGCSTRSHSRLRIPAAKLYRCQKTSGASLLT